MALPLLNGSFINFLLALSCPENVDPDSHDYSTLPPVTDTLIATVVKHVDRALFKDHRGEVKPGNWNICCYMADSNVALKGYLKCSGKKNRVPITEATIIFWDCGIRFGLRLSPNTDRSIVTHFAQEANRRQKTWTLEGQQWTKKTIEQKASIIEEVVLGDDRERAIRISKGNNLLHLGQFSRILDGADRLKRLLEVKPFDRKLKVPSYFKQRLNHYYKLRTTLQETVRKRKGERGDLEDSFADLRQIMLLTAEITACEQFIRHVKKYFCKDYNSTRRKGLVIVGPRGCGKTILVKSLLGFTSPLQDRIDQLRAMLKNSSLARFCLMSNEDILSELSDLENPKIIRESLFQNDYIIHIRGQVNAVEFQKENRAVLTLFDDVLVAIGDKNDKRDREMLKALIVSEATAINGKYVNFHFKHGIPFVLLTNDIAYCQQLQNDPEFNQDCMIIEFQWFVGPLSIQQDMEEERSSSHYLLEEETKNPSYEALQALYAYY